MREQIVQTTGHPQPLLGDPATGLLLTGAFRAFGAFHDVCDVLAVETDVHATEENGDDPAGDPQDLQHAVGVGEGVDDQCHADDGGAGEQRTACRAGHRDRVEHRHRHGYGRGMVVVERVQRRDLDIPGRSRDTVQNSVARDAVRRA